MHEHGSPAEKSRRNESAKLRTTLLQEAVCINTQRKPNLLLVLVDQLRACSIPLYGEKQIETPHMDALASKGVTFTNAVSSCPVCTPYRSMLLTGRHPQTTGHVVNFVRTRHDEIGFGDVFKRAGYKTGYVGKWHLHTGSFPEIQGKDYVPEGRDRLGFDYWRAYNFHMEYFKGSINVEDWHSERWEGYETDALNRYAFEFLDQVGEEPFCLFVSPHQPHVTPLKSAPDHYYEKVPENLTLPENVPPAMKETCLKQYRDYLAMILACDDMLGELMDRLEKSGQSDNTLVIFTSDHGSQFGAQGIAPWAKKMPYEESVKVPLVVRWPGVLEAGGTCDTLVSPVDFMPTLCRLCGVPIPRTVEGYDLSEAWLGKPDAFERDSVLTMNFNRVFDYLVEGDEWRGVRTKRYSYARWLNGKTELFDIVADPLQLTNLAEDRAHAGLAAEMETRLLDLMSERGDRLVPASYYRDWFDAQRRVVKNAHGSLGHPESEPDWSLF